MIMERVLHYGENDAKWIHTYSVIQGHCKQNMKTQVFHFIIVQTFQGKGQCTITLQRQTRNSAVVKQRALCSCSDNI